MAIQARLVDTRPRPRLPGKTPAAAPQSQKGPGPHHPTPSPPTSIQTSTLRNRPWTRLNHTYTYYPAPNSIHDSLLPQNDHEIPSPWSYSRLLLFILFLIRPILNRTTTTTTTTTLRLSPNPRAHCLSAPDKSKLSPATRLLVCPIHSLRLARICRQQQP